MDELIPYRKCLKCGRGFINYINPNECPTCKIDNSIPMNIKIGDSKFDRQKKTNSNRRRAQRQKRNRKGTVGKNKRTRDLES